VTVNEVPGTTTVIGSGAAGGPSRRVDVFEDCWVHGNARCGIARVTKLHLPDGGSATTETPRLSTEVSNSELSVIGAGPNNSPNQRLVKVYDNLVVSNNASVSNDVFITGDVAVGGALSVVGATTLVGVNASTLITTSDVTVGGNLDIGSTTEWHNVKAQNAVIAAGTFHVYDRGSGVVANLVCGFGFDGINPIFFTPSAAWPAHIGIFSAKLMLAVPVSCPTVIITPWLIGQYDETNVVTTPVLVLPAAVPPFSLDPVILIKGVASGPAGAVPATTMCVGQVDIAFYSCGLCTNFVPVNGSPASDLVFDVKVLGGECVL
jgi:hypothetical protein